MVTSDFRPEVEIRQFHTCALKNDTVGHNGRRYHVPQNVFLVSKVFDYSVFTRQIIMLY